MSEHTKLLRIYTDEAAYYGDRKVLEVVASKARDARLAGVTVLEALIGFGRSAHLHRRHVLESDRAVVIEIVDFDARLRGVRVGPVRRARDRIDDARSSGGSRVRAFGQQYTTRVRFGIRVRIVLGD
ncbi:DUF190 domain-containing protein [uncultured Bradyrhizobium sp.]|uniref:DUF190 domain-containing protein n=1 Tax=uncultured Bradyrhizobium sp. TaxID=199684 RepID=UPI00262A7DA2|nr:DUF190 domain-containing protein [uncultured Bradyrhizobium sp.]